MASSTGSPSRGRRPAAPGATSWARRRSRRRARRRAASGRGRSAPPRRGTARPRVRAPPSAARWRARGGARPAPAARAAGGTRAPRDRGRATPAAPPPPAGVRGRGPRRRRRAPAGWSHAACTGPPAARVGRRAVRRGGARPSPNPRSSLPSAATRAAERPSPRTAWAGDGVCAHGVPSRRRSDSPRRDRLTTLTRRRPSRRGGAARRSRAGAPRGGSRSRAPRSGRGPPRGRRGRRARRRAGPADPASRARGRAWR